MPASYQEASNHRVSYLSINRLKATSPHTSPLNQQTRATKLQTITIRHACSTLQTYQHRAHPPYKASLKHKAASQPRQLPKRFQEIEAEGEKRLRDELSAMVILEERMMLLDPYEEHTDEQDESE